MQTSGKPGVPARAGRNLEAAFVTLIALAVAAGGRSLLATVAHGGLLAACWAAVLAGGLLAGLWRRRSAGASPVVLTRDIAFLAAALLSIFYIDRPARWSSGATIAALEFGLLLELLSILLPGARPGTSGAPIEPA
jgi:hypothetical protein